MRIRDLDEVLAGRPFRRDLDFLTRGIVSRDLFETSHLSMKFSVS